MAAPKTETAPKSIEDLTAQYQQLLKKQTQAETRREAAREALEALRAEAKKTYGTDDVGELRQKLDEMTKENERKRAEYQTALAKIETDLQKVESEFVAVESPTNGKNA